MFTTPTDVRSARPAIAVAVLAALAVALLAVLPNVMASASPAPVAKISQLTTIQQSSYGVWSDSVRPAVPSDDETSAVTLGLEFSSSTPGQVYGVQYYAAGANRVATTGAVWNASGNRVASVTFPASSTDGWKTAWLSSPAKIRAGEKYTVSYRAPNGRYASQENVFDADKTVSTKGLTAYRGTYSYGSGRPTNTWHGSHYFIDVAFVPSTGGTTPTPTTPAPTTPAPTTPAPTTPAPTTPAPTTPAPTTPAPTTPAPTTPAPTTPTPGAFPDTSNTGDPSTADNTSYTGSMTVSANGTVIDNKTINGTLNITGDNVVIRNSTINGSVYFQQSNAGGRIEDSTVVNTGRDGAGINYYNYTALRVEVTGGRVSMSCDTNCTVIDSLLWKQQTQGAWHGDGFLSNGGSGYTLRHNTIHCDGPATGTGACSAAVAMYGDWSPITNVLVENNLFPSSPAGYCMYAGYDPGKPSGTGTANVRIINNTFAHGTSGKCAVYGPVAAVAPSGNGNVFSGNVWDDGKAISAP